MHRFSGCVADAAVAFISAVPRSMQPLPIDPLLPAIQSSLRRAPNLVLEAPPGAGKTTRVPRALLDDAAPGEILVLEPRRLAARMAAQRVAEEMGEPVGKTVGYKVRFEDATSAHTRVCFVTEGILTRRLLGDPRLAGVGTVLLDEFHERHLHGDVALALLRRLHTEQLPDLRLVVMSATLESAPVAAFLGGAPVLRSEGRLYEVTLEHASRADDRPLHGVIAGALRRLVDDGLAGDVLVFLPGTQEIRKAIEACQPLARSADLLTVPLHGSLSMAEQDRAVRPADRRKVIFATNVAETSVTIDGVVAVIDSGLARVAAHAPWSGLPTLRVARISRASAIQRAGRAGRTRPGHCIRLYTSGDLMARPEHDTPEIARLDLAETALELAASGISDLASFGWFEPPPATSLSAAEALLERLGAVERSTSAEKGRPAEGIQVTPLGRRMLAFPVHPRQARMIVEAERRGVVAEGCALAALVGEREISASRARRSEGHRSDLLAALADFEQAAQRGFAFDSVRALGLDPARVTAVQRTAQQLARISHRGGAVPSIAPDLAEARETELLITILAGYPDRVGRLRRPANATGRAGIEILFAAGGTAKLADTSGIAETDLVVAVDVEERTEQGREHGFSAGAGGRAKTLVRMASAIEADWLLELFTHAVKDTSDVVWNEDAGRVEAVRRLAYDGLVLEETRRADVAPEFAGRALATAARARGVRSFIQGADLDRWLARVAFVREHCPALGLPVVDEAALETALERLCEGKRSFAELEAADPMRAVTTMLSSEQARGLSEMAPERVVLPGGRQARVDYAKGASPSLAARLQDFFGMAAGPSLAGGRVPVVLHLLAPNQRAVQITTDLAGFWVRHYPTLAKELRRRYPRHSFPEDPRTAKPSPPNARKNTSPRSR